MIEVRTTLPSRAAADACADRLVGGGLAACVQVDGPIESRYVWRGSQERAAEWRCTCKTTPARQAACIAAILADHPYETPEILVVAATAAPGYAAWVRDAVSDS